ncbi:MAG: LysR substrate-binding domain-containing protein [Halofilum sp. (in: g-proteobacteria)]
MTWELPPLNWLRTFEAAARRSSFAEAARELSMTQPAVSNHIRLLEQYIGVDLFTRHARRVEVSEMGGAYLDAVRHALSQLSGTTAGLFGLSGERSVTVRCTPSFAMLWLARRLPVFAEANPNIVVRLFSAPWAESSALERADIDIFWGDGNWTGYDTELLYRGPSVPLCSPALRERIGPEPSAADCAAQPLIHILGCENFWVRWLAEGGIDDPPPWRGIKVDNSVGALEVAASGYGLALVLERYARPYIESGQLVVPIRRFLDSERGLYVARAWRETPTRPEAQLFRDWLFDELANDEDEPVIGAPA